MDNEVCHANHLAKARCTKRLRPLSSGDVAIPTAISSISLSKEEEDKANSLILLAQGEIGENEGSVINNNTKQISIAITNATTIPALALALAPTTIVTTTVTSSDVYECKTCNRTFHCFQALGGHMAGHKKQKMILEEIKGLPPLPPPPLSLRLPSQSSMFGFEEAKKSNVESIPKIPIFFDELANIGAFHGNKSKIHECSTCGAKFSSGQALGGHKRKHRLPANVNASTTPVVKNMSGYEKSFDNANATNIVEVETRIVRDVDLNLPAPEKDI